MPSRLGVDPFGLVYDCHRSFGRCCSRGFAKGDIFVGWLSPWLKPWANIRAVAPRLDFDPYKTSLQTVSIRPIIRDDSTPW